MLNNRIDPLSDLRDKAIDFYCTQPMSITKAVSHTFSEYISEYKHLEHALWRLYNRSTALNTPPDDLKLALFANYHNRFCLAAGIASEAAMYTTLLKHAERDLPDLLTAKNLGISGDKLAIELILLVRNRALKQV